MSKTCISAALFAATGLTSLTAAAADGTITFTGNVSDVTCIVTGGDNTNGGTSNFTVALPSVQANALDTAGDTAGDTPFTVVLSGPNCKDGKAAKVWFESSTPTIDAAHGGRLKNTAAGGATNVLIGVLNKAGAPIDMSNNAGGDGSKETISGNTATLHYMAQYYAIGAATPGDVNTFVNYSVVYN